MSETETATPSQSLRVQPMPDLSPQQYRALREDIALNGVIVPIIVDQNGRILDGNNRAAIAADLGIDCPTDIRAVESEDEAIDLAITLNCARRHLTRDQQRALILSEIDRCPDDSDRAIARRVGCSHVTVGAARRISVVKLTTSMSVAEAEMLTAQIQEKLREIQNELWFMAIAAMSNEISPAEIIMAFTAATRSMQREGLDDQGVFGKYVYGPVIDMMLDPLTVEEYRGEWDHETFLPLTDDEKANLLTMLAAPLPSGGV